MVRDENENEDEDAMQRGDGGRWWNAEGGMSPTGGGCGRPSRFFSGQLGIAKHSRKERGVARHHSGRPCPRCQACPAMADPAARPRKRARDDGGDGAASTAGPGPGTMTSNGHASNGNGTPSPAAAASAAGGSAPAMSTASIQASTAVGDPYQQAGSSPTDAAQQPAPAAVTTRPAMYDRRDRPLSRATLDQSFFCVEPHDEFTREVGDWIWGWIHNRQNVEVRTLSDCLSANDAVPLVPAAWLKPALAFLTRSHTDRGKDRTARRQQARLAAQLARHLSAWHRDEWVCSASHGLG